MDNLKEFMERDAKELAKENSDFTFHVQGEFNDVLERCA